MKDSKIDRINELARKSKAEGLTPEEKQEQQNLRHEYIAGFRKSMISVLDSTYIVDEEGNKRKVERKNKKRSH